MFSAIIDIFVI